MIQKRKALTALAVAGVLVGLTACAGNNAAEPKEETKTESSDSTLVIYSGRDEKLIGPLIEKFEETSGIKTEVRYAGSAEQAQLLITEGKNTPAHVLKSDARKAAKYTNESIEKSMNLKLEESKKMYDKSQKIIEKYRSSKESDKFFEYYRRYRDEGKIQKEEQS